MAKQLYSFLHPYRRRVRTEIPEGSKVQSEFARELDINYLVEKHIRAGIPFPQATQQDFADVADLPDFQAAQDILANAKQAWYSLDPKVRREFNDKPERFLEALHDPSQTEELIRLKVFKKPEQTSQDNKPEVAPPKAERKGPGGPAKAGGGREPPSTVVT